MNCDMFAKFWVGTEYLVFPTSFLSGIIHSNFKLKGYFLVSCYYDNEAGVQKDQ